MSDREYSKPAFAQFLRRQLLAQSAVLLGTVGFDPERARDQQAQAIVAVAKIAASLVGGICALDEKKNYYPVAALVRQIVEIEYLLYAFSYGHKLTHDWFAGDRDARLRLFQPRHLYEIPGSPFRKTDYGLHCEHGGHPTPAGVWLTHISTEKAEELLCEALMHIRHIMICLEKWLAEHLPEVSKQELAQWNEVRQAFVTFVNDDPLLSAMKNKLGNQ